MPTNDPLNPIRGLEDVSLDAKKQEKQYNDEGETKPSLEVLEGKSESEINNKLVEKFKTQLQENAKSFKGDVVDFFQTKLNRARKSEKKVALQQLIDEANQLSGKFDENLEKIDDSVDNASAFEHPLGQFENDEDGEGKAEKTNDSKNRSGGESLTEEEAEAFEKQVKDERQAKDDLEAATDEESIIADLTEAKREARGDKMSMFTIDQEQKH